ncbi:MAG: hypothetical protein EP329_14370 [Deltaproteobacteria bacterium]|nr:MAG: hypothetical protein EP329_14370 [Deltaproteobacteria bacterium]
MIHHLRNSLVKHLLPLAALSLAGSAWAAAPEDAVPPADTVVEDEPVNLEAEVVVSDAALTQWLREGKALFDDERYLDAALKFRQLVETGQEMNPLVQEAQFSLGASLFELGLYQSALTRFEPIVDTGAEHPQYAKTLVYLLKISRATGSDPSVLLKIADYPPELYPPDLKDELHFLVGLYFYGESRLSEALTRFQEVSERNEEFFVRAKFLEGVIRVAQSGLGTEAKEIDSDTLTQASEAFKAVLRVQRDQGSSETIDRVAGQAILALGRLFYSTRQYDVAVRYYNEIPDESAEWLDSLYEVSWVHYQLKNYPRALGNLHTLNSPYFADQYYPESRVLQALILFYNCRYDEADVIVKQFVQDYFPLMDRLGKEINQFADPNAFYQWLAQLSKSEDAEYSTRFKRIFNAALADKKLRRKFDTVAKLNAELSRIDKLAGPQGATDGLLGSLKGEITGYRFLVVGEAGGLAQARLVRLLGDLRRHLAGAIKIRQETRKARRGDSSDGVLQEQAAAAAAKQEIVVDDEHIEWPFTGEYWKDELGSYLYDIDSLCKMEPESGGAPAPTPAEGGE